MFTKKQWVDLVVESLNGGVAPDQRKYHPEVVGKFIAATANSIIAASIKEGMAQGDNIVSSDWIKTSNKAKIKYDSVREQCYITPPFKILYMEGNMGVREIGWPVQDGSPTFRIMDASAYQVISNLECAQLPTAVYFALIEGERIYFPEMKALNVGKKLMIKAIGSFDAYENDEVVPMEEDKAILLLNGVNQAMAQFAQRRQKVTNDTNPNTI